MVERFHNLFALPKKLYQETSPLIIAAGALLKDNQTGRIIVQLKLKSISPKTIKAVKVKIVQLDSARKALGEPVYYDYLDLEVGRDEEFGQKSAIFLPDTVSRSFSAQVCEVVFTDSSVWQSTSDIWEPLPEASSVQEKGLLDQYRLEYGPSAQYIIQQYKDLWYCACGEINHNGEDICHSCGNTLSMLLVCDFDELNRHKEERIVKEKEEQEAKAEAERIAGEKSKLRRKKTLKICIPAAVLCIAAFFLITKVIIPNQDYKAAVELFESEDYEGSIKAFEALDGFKDSTEKIKEANELILARDYSAAEALLEAEKYDEAIMAFKRIYDYRDSTERIAEANESMLARDYAAAESLLEAKKYDEAIASFNSIREYKDSNDKIKECNYQLALNIWNNLDRYDDTSVAASEKKKGEIERLLAYLNEVRGYNDDVETMYASIRRVVSVERQDAERYEFYYNEYGSLSKVCHYDFSRKLSEKSYIYDNEGRLMQVVYKNESDEVTHTFNYKYTNRILNKIEDSAKTYTYKVDSLGNVIESTFPGIFSSITHNYTYDGKGRLITQDEDTYYKYNSKGQLVEILQTAGDVFKDLYELKIEFTYDNDVLTKIKRTYGEDYFMIAMRNQTFSREFTWKYIIVTQNSDDATIIDVIHDFYYPGYKEL